LIETEVILHNGLCWERLNPLLSGVMILLADSEKKVNDESGAKESNARVLVSDVPTPDNRLDSTETQGTVPGTKTDETVCISATLPMLLSSGAK
jgi:hypothetical protein